MDIQSHYQIKKLLKKCLILIKFKLDSKKEEIEEIEVEEEDSEEDQE